jgi:hypothetical protein
MSIWTWLVFFLGLYAGTYIPKQWRIKFEDTIANILSPKQKKVQPKVNAETPVGVA